MYNALYFNMCGGLGKTLRMVRFSHFHISDENYRLPGLKYFSDMCRSGTSKVAPFESLVTVKCEVKNKISAPRCPLFFHFVSRGLSDLSFRYRPLCTVLCAGA